HEGRRLFGHELAHVAQQAHREPMIQCMPDDRARDHQQVSMHFDGHDLIVRADDTEVFRFAAQSGRPVRLRDEYAKRAAADPVTDSYMNDSRFVGVADFGPIPEGTYRFSPRLIQRFSTGKQLGLLVTPHAQGGGDWGAGRVALTKVGRVRDGPFGSTNTRAG